MSALAGILILAVCADFAAANWSNHECERPCIAKQPPKECRYVFTLQPFITFHRRMCGDCPQNESDCMHSRCITASGANRTFLSVNRQLPGKTIQVCLGDVVQVEVRNRLPGGAEGAIHWHGLSHRHSPYMDGVPMVTQCPVPPGADFQYRFVADRTGTHFYHAHSVLQQADGIYGALIVRSSEETRHDEDHLLVFAPWYDAMQTGAYGAINGDLLSHNAPAALLLNGRAAIPNSGQLLQLARVSVNSDKRVLLRLVNAAALDCPIEVTIESHALRVLRVAGASVKPIAVNYMLIYPGERYDVEVITHTPGEYVMHAKGMNACKTTMPLHAKFEVLGDNTKKFSNNMVDSVDFQRLTSDCINESSSDMCSLDLQEADSTILPVSKKQADISFFLPFGRAPVSPVNKNDLEFRFVLDDIAYYPTFLNDVTSMLYAPHLNNVTFRLPASPPLVHPEDEVALSRGICESFPTTASDEPSPPARRPLGACRPSPHYCECTHVLRVQLNSTIDVTLSHAIFDDEDGSYSVHLHGHTFHVTRWRSLLQQKWHHVKHPVLRDTVAVPRGGAVTLQFRADNPGFWLLEARAGHVASAGVGVAAVLQVGDRTQILPVPKNFPRCSGIRPDDVIF